MAVDTGKVVQVLGNVVDVEFTPETLPHINDALRVGVNEVSLSNGASAATKSAVNLGGTAMAAREITLEVQDELGDNQVRCLALGSTDGLVRGAPVRSVGGPITVPVGEGTLGRLFNVLADSSASAGAQVSGADRTRLRNGNQSRRLNGAVYARRKGRSLWRCRRRQDRSHSRVDSQHRLRSQGLLGVYRRRRTDARRQRPLAGNERVRRARANDARLRADGRAARRAISRSPNRRHDGGVLPG